MFACSLWSYGHFSFKNLLHARQVFRRSKVSIATKTWDLESLWVVHFSWLYCSVVLSTQLFDPYLPVVQLPQLPINVIIYLSDICFVKVSVLDIVDLVNYLFGDLFSPFLTLLNIMYLSNVNEAFWSFLVLFVDQVSLHRPPSVEHALSFLWISCHSSN